MNFLVADRIVSSRGVNIQLWASGAILHYKDSEELLHLLTTEWNNNFHFCSNVQTIPPRPFKTFFSRFNLHMKGDNISKEFCFKFKRKLVSALCPLCQRTGLILYLKASQPEEDPFCRCNWVQRVYTPMKNSTTHTTSLIRALPHGKKHHPRLNPETSHWPLAVSPSWAKSFNS